MGTQRPPVFGQRRRIAALVFALTVVLLASACGGGTGVTPPPPAASPTEPTPVGTVTVSKFECALEGVSGPIRAGDVAFTVVNETGNRAIVVMAAIPEGHSYEQLAANIEKAKKSARQGGPVVPHLDWLPLAEALEVMLSAGQSGSMTGSVDPGTYGIACLRFYPLVGELRPNGVAGPVEVE